MFCINKWCHPGWLNQYICINSQFLAACSGGCLLLPLQPLKFQRETNNNNKTPLFFPRLTFHLYLSITVAALIVLEENNSRITGLKPFQHKVIHLVVLQTTGAELSSSVIRSRSWNVLLLQFRFSSHSFSNPTLIQRSLLLFPSIVAYLRVWVQQCEIRKLQFKKGPGAVVSGRVHIARRSLLHW